MTSLWRGYWPASVTPFGEDGAVDYEGIDALCELYRTLGVHGVLVNGSSGEWFAQSRAERESVAARFAANLGGEIPVVVGCTSFTPDETVSLGNAALEAGAAGVCFTPPPYARPDGRELLHFFEDACERIDGPVMVYNWPRGTGIDIPTEQLRQLAGIPNVAAIKDSTTDYARHLTNLQNMPGVAFFAHYVSRVGLGVLLEAGGVGSIDGGSLGAPFAVPFYEAFWNGDLDTARSLAARYDAFLSDLVGPGFVGRYASQIPQIKAAMALMGQPGGVVRPPMLAPTAESLDGIRAVLVTHGLLDR
jgi:4-hydroxy-tetrahydrodipicolinate synthase